MVSSCSYIFRNGPGIRAIRRGEKPNVVRCWEAGNGVWASRSSISIPYSRHTAVPFRFFLFVDLAITRKPAIDWWLKKCSVASRRLPEPSGENPTLHTWRRNGDGAVGHQNLPAVTDTFLL